MKLVRWGEAGAERPGLLDKAGAVRDLSAHIDDIDGAALAPAALDRLRALDPDSLPPAPAGARLGSPVTRIPTFHCVGLNYRKHAAEVGAEPPAEPILFVKTASALAGPFDPLTIPKDSAKTDWEVELGVVIGQVTEHVSEAEALSRVAGYCVVNDVSEREWQQERGGTWSKGKGAPGFGPTGPWLVTADEVPDPQALDLWTDLNGQRVQHSNTSDMIFSVAQIVSYMSRMMRLLPGDVIATGTPSGVGAGMKPQRFLRSGDVLEMGVQGLGAQRVEARAWKG